MLEKINVKIWYVSRKHKKADKTHKRGYDAENCAYNNVGKQDFSTFYEDIFEVFAGLDISCSSFIQYSCKATFALKFPQKVYILHVLNHAKNL